MNSSHLFLHIHSLFYNWFPCQFGVADALSCCSVFHWIFIGCVFALNGSSQPNLWSNKIKFTVSLYRQTWTLELNYLHQLTHNDCANALKKMNNIHFVLHWCNLFLMCIDNSFQFEWTEYFASLDTIFISFIHLLQILSFFPCYPISSHVFLWKPFGCIFIMQYIICIFQ